MYVHSRDIGSGEWEYRESVVGMDLLWSVIGLGPKLLTGLGESYTSQVECSFSIQWLWLVGK